MTIGRMSRSRARAAGAVLLMVVIGSLSLRWWQRHEKRSHFVSIGDHGFELNGRPFFPLAVNYVIAKRLVCDSMWLGTCIDYPDSMLIPLTPGPDHADLRAHLELAREMGFNTVRLVGCSNVLEREGRPYMPFYRFNLRDSLFALDSAGMRERYLDAFADMLDIVRGSGLKAIVHVGVVPNQPATEEHFVCLARRFANDTTILAWDLYNEPLYFDPLWREKSEVNAIGDHWRALMREHAPWQLWTLGLANMREFLEWDPTIINADFFSFHPYEHEPEQVLNELYYYAHHCPKPWIVGETAISADNDSVPYSEQLGFARSTLRQSVACGAWGYSWWQFKDVDWHRFDPNFMGVLNREGTTRTRSQRLVEGTVKPLAEAFQEFDPSAPAGTCECPANYFNWTGGQAYRFTGRLLDEHGAPVTDGIVMAWSPDWAQLRNTVTHPDGTFELVTDIPIAHWTASAPGRTRASGEVDHLVPDTVRGGQVHAQGDVELWTAPLGE